jgi:SMODS and SLOG-associating 2TM effector domain 1
VPALVEVFLERIKDAGSAIAATDRTSSTLDARAKRRTVPRASPSWRVIAMMLNPRLRTAVTAHITAARYDHLVIEYLRTAQRLQHLRDAYLNTLGEKAAEFIDACEDAISVETGFVDLLGARPPLAERGQPGGDGRGAERPPGGAA